jgi:hypothetical protein
MVAENVIEAADVRRMRTIVRACCSYHVPMRLCAMHDPKVLASVARLPAPPLCQWMAAPLDSPGQPLGCFAHGNLLSPDFAFDAELPGDWIFAWSGTLAEQLTEGSPMNWMRGPALLDEACASLRPQLERHKRRLLLVPHARHVLSDAYSSLMWWNRQVDTRPPHGQRSFGLAFDPGALLEPSMLPDMADHLRSLFAAIGPRADAVILRGWRVRAPAAGAEDGSMEACAFAEGFLGWEQAQALVQEFIPSDVPVLVPGPAVAQAKHAFALG